MVDVEKECCEDGKICVVEELFVMVFGTVDGVEREVGRKEAVGEQSMGEEA